ncbi:MAG: C40 family peptidase [Flavitalea sp.]
MTQRNVLFLFFILVGLSSCSSFKKAVTPAEPVYSAKKKSSPFLENITIKPTSSSPKVRAKKGVSPGDTEYAVGFTTIETADALKFKYAILMNMPVEELSDTRPLEFLEEWYGTPYRYGGSTKEGIDCSAFTSFFMNTVYSITLPRTSREQYSNCERIKKNELSPGDLVFFAARKTISHVGVYMGNNKFAHASTSGGVMISDLDEEYFRKKYAGAGRVM